MATIEFADGTGDHKKLPTITMSNAVIKSLAPMALERLEQHNATDLIDALGLRPYV